MSTVMGIKIKPSGNYYLNCAILAAISAYPQESLNPGINLN
jgi:hypothetical protein